MTRYRITIDELLLQDVPPELADGLGRAVRQRLTALAADPQPAPHNGTVRTTDDLAGRIAQAVWDRVRSGGAS